MGNVINHKDASHLLDVNERTLTRLITENEIQYVKKGRERLYNEDDILKLKPKTEMPVIEKKIYMVGSPKGGTGKTTIIKHLSTILANEGKKVLVVDADPQHYYTDFIVSSWEDQRKAKIRDFNLHTLLKEEHYYTKAIYEVTKKISFIPGSRKLEQYDRELLDVVARELKLKKSLVPTLPQYDYILMDSSPAQSGITMAALIAAHILILPIIPDVDSLEAAKDIIKSINKIQDSDLSEKFKLSEIYILPVKQKKGFGSKFAKQILEDIKETFGQNELSIQTEILEPVLDYKNIPEESYAGILKDNTDSFNNYKKSLLPIL